MGYYYGKFRGKISRVPTDDNYGRVYITVPSLLGSEELGLAMPCSSGSANVNRGSFHSAREGDNIWVEFEGGDPSKPIYAGGFWTKRDGGFSSPEHVRGLPHDTDFAGRGVGTIPPSSFKATPMQTDMIMGPGGFFEVDSTQGNERMQMCHKTGSRVEFKRDGSSEHVTVGDKREQVIESFYTEIKGTRKVEIKGDSHKLVRGKVKVEHQKFTTFVFSDVDSVGGSLTEQWENWNVASRGKIGIIASGNLKMASGSQVTLLATKDMNLTSLENVCVFVGGGISPTAPTSFEVTTLKGGIALLDGMAGTGFEAFSTPNPTNGSCVVGGASMVGGIFGGRIDVLTTPGANVHLGGFPANSQLILGTTFMPILVAALTAITAFMTGFKSPVTGISCAATASTALIPLLTQFMSTLSTTVWTK